MNPLALATIDCGQGKGLALAFTLQPSVEVPPRLAALTNAYDHATPLAATSPLGAIPQFRWSMRLKLISCEVFEREVRAGAARSTNRVDVELLAKAPHQLSDRERTHYLQTAVDRAGRSNYQGVLLLAGSCKHGLTGLEARSIPLVLPRAKDCISLLLEHASLQAKTAPHATQQNRRSDDASSGRMQSTASSRAADWILPTTAPALSSRRPGVAANPSWSWRQSFARKPASVARKGRKSAAMPGQSLLEMLLGGYWNHTDFLVVAAGWRIVVNHDQGTINSEEILP